MDNKNIIILVLAVAVVGLAYLYFSGSPVISGLGEKADIEEVAQKALAYVNTLAGGEAVLTGNNSEENGLYKIEIDYRGQEDSFYVTTDGKLFFLQSTDLEEFAEQEANKPAELGTTLGEFTEYEAEICLEDGKPIVYFFGSSGCPHCGWEHPVLEKAAAKFGDLIAFHNNMDSQEDMDVFTFYNPRGSVPTVVLGCKYGRVGSGESDGEELEEENLTKLICDLTGGEPQEVCAE